MAVAAGWLISATCRSGCRTGLRLVRRSASPLSPRSGCLTARLLPERPGRGSCSSTPKRGDARRGQTDGRDVPPQPIARRRYRYMAISTIHVPRSGDVPPPDLPPIRPVNPPPGPTSPPMVPGRDPAYSPEDLIGSAYLGLFLAGVLPSGPMPDPAGARRAAVDLLRAFGVRVAS